MLGKFILSTLPSHERIFCETSNRHETIFLFSALIDLAPLFNLSLSLSLSLSPSSLPLFGIPESFSGFDPPGKSLPQIVSETETR